MNQTSSTYRHFLYVAIGMVATGQNGAGVSFGWNWETASYCLAVLGAGLVASRAYVDQSQSGVVPSPSPPVTDPKPYQQTIP